MMAFIMAVFFVVFYLVWLWTMPNVTYTDKEFFKYYLLTYAEIKNAPRLSEDYYFEYGPSDESDPQTSIMYTCGLSNVDESYGELLSYIKSTGKNLSAGYSLDNPPKHGDEYFFLSETSLRGGEKCLMLSFSKEVN
ncbi:TPA: hypothetical protein ACSTLU_002186 [Serratia fonticola]